MKFAIPSILGIIGLFIILAYRPSSSVSPCQQSTNKKIANTLGVSIIVIAVISFFVIDRGMIKS